MGSTLAFRVKESTGALRPDAAANIGTAGRLLEHRTDLALLFPVNLVTDVVRVVFANRVGHQRHQVRAAVIAPFTATLPNQKVISAL